MAISLRDQIDLDRACAALWEPLIDWVQRPSEGKLALFHAYASLTHRERLVLARDVKQAFEAAHGSDEVTAYRYLDQAESRGGHLGLTSLTTTEPSYLARSQYVAYRVRACDVLAHWAQTCLPLGSKQFGHERELVLKPDANPPRENPIHPHPLGLLAVMAACAGAIAWGVHVSLKV